MYQTRGLAEIVRNPSDITIYYLDRWFTGASSFGKALTMLGWPITQDEMPLLVWNKKDGLRLDLKREEKVMYSKTVLHYVKVNNDYIIKIDPSKLISPKHIWYTTKAVWSQSKLLLNPQGTYDLAKKYVDTISLEIPKGKEAIELNIQNNVWPYVIAVDYIGEFVYSTLVNKLNENQKGIIISKLHKRIRSKDWYTQAILAWSNLQENHVPHDEFIKKYGFAANNEYELTCPRYYELLNAKKPQIKPIRLESIKVMNLEDLYVGTQYLRSQAKHKSLIWISALRDSLLQSKHI